MLLFTPSKIHFLALFNNNHYPFHRNKKDIPYCESLYPRLFFLRRSLKKNTHANAPLSCTNQLIIWPYWAKNYLSITQTRQLILYFAFGPEGSFTASEYKNARAMQ